MCFWYGEHLYVRKDTQMVFRRLQPALAFEYHAEDCAMSLGLCNCIRDFKILVKQYFIFWAVKYKKLQLKKYQKSSLCLYSFCGSAVRAGRPPITGWAVRPPAPPVCMLKCPRARLWTLHCSRWSGQHLALQLAAMTGCINAALSSRNK